MVPFAPSLRSARGSAATPPSPHFEFRRCPPFRRCRSPFETPGGGNKTGEKIVDQRVTTSSDPAGPPLLAQPFDVECFPVARQPWIANGMRKPLHASRRWTRKRHTQATGASSSFTTSGGRNNIDELIGGAERGILVIRPWYLREVDPRTILYRGLTRVGTFLIENRKVAKSVSNVRFNRSPLFMLHVLQALGPSERLAGTEQGGAIAMPSSKVRDFNCTSLSEAVYKRGRGHAVSNPAIHRGIAREFTP